MTRDATPSRPSEPDGSDQKTLLVREHGNPVSALGSPRGRHLLFSPAEPDRLPQQDSRATRSCARDAVATTLITGLETDRAFALSSDGTRLVYARAPYHSNLWMLEPGGPGNNQGAEPRQLTQGTSHIERPRVSPDGTSIVFNIGHEPLTELYTMPVTGGSPKQLTFLDSFSVGGVWSPDGKRIAFASTRGGKPRVWTVTADGGIPRALSSSNLSDTFRPRLVPRVSDPVSSRPGIAITTNSIQRPEMNGCWQGTARSAGCFRRSIRLTAGKLPSNGIAARTGVFGSLTSRTVTRRWCTRPSAGSSTMPIGWSADGSSIYVVEAKTSTARDLAAPLGETMTEAKILIGACGRRGRENGSLSSLRRDRQRRHDPRRPQVYLDRVLVAVRCMGRRQLRCVAGTESRESRARRSSIDAGPRVSLDRGWRQASARPRAFDCDPGRRLNHRTGRSCRCDRSSRTVEPA